MLTSVQNPLVKQIKKLHSPKYRRQEQLFLLEGTHLLTEALATSYPVNTICCTPEWQETHGELWELATQTAQRCEIVSPQVLEVMATTVQPDGVVATASRRTPEIFTGTLDFGIALETIQDPGNLGTMIRTAAAAGVREMWLSTDCADIDQPKVLRASAGAWFRLPLQVCEDLQASVQQCRQAGVQVVATTSYATQLYWELDYCRPTLILLGNEGAGLSSEMMKLADRQVKIPLGAGVESLNVAIAAAVILYEVQRQRSTIPQTQFP